MSLLLKSTYKNSTTRVKGVTRTKNGTFIARLTYKGKLVTEKRFKTIDQAKNYLEGLRKQILAAPNQK